MTKQKPVLPVFSDSIDKYGAGVYSHSALVRPSLDRRGKLPVPLDLRLFLPALSMWFGCWLWAMPGAGLSAQALIFLALLCLVMLVVMHLVPRRRSGHSALPSGSFFAALTLIICSFGVSGGMCSLSHYVRNQDSMYKLLQSNPNSSVTAGQIGFTSEVLRGRVHLRLQGYPRLLSFNTQQGLKKESVLYSTDRVPNGTNKSIGNTNIQETNGYATNKAKAEPSTVEYFIPAKLVGFENKGHLYRANLPVDLRLKNTDFAYFRAFVEELMPGQLLKGAGSVQIVNTGFGVGLSQETALSKIVVKARNLAVDQHAGAFRIMLTKLRASLIGLFLPEEKQPTVAGAISVALTLGKKDAMSKQLSDHMQDASLSHLVTVSGMHMSIVMGVVLGLTRLLARRVQIVASLLTLMFMVNLVDAGPSVWRAAVMGGISLMALGLNRESKSIPSLCIAVIVLLAIDPLTAYSWGFLLSVGVTFGIVTIGSALGRLLSRFLPRIFALPIAVVISAQVSSAPLLFLMNEKIPLWGVITNLLVSPLVSVVCAGGLGLGILALCNSPTWLLSPGVWVVKTAAGWIGGVARWASTWPGAQIPWISSENTATRVFGCLLLVLMSASMYWLVREASDWQERRRGRSLKSSVRLPKPGRVNHLLH